VECRENEAIGHDGEREKQEGGENQRGGGKEEGRRKVRGGRKSDHEGRER
jgi:hypothetical protein